MKRYLDRHINTDSKITDRTGLVYSIPYGLTEYTIPKKDKLYWLLNASIRFSLIDNNKNNSIKLYVWQKNLI